MSPSQPRPGSLAHMARWIARHAWTVVLAWAVLLVSLGLVWRSNQGDFVDTLDLPGAESQQAVDLLKERLPAQAGDQATIVIRAESGMASPAVRANVEAMVAEAKAIDGVVDVIPPYAEGANAISADGTTGIIVVRFAQAADEVPAASVDALHDLRDRYDGKGMQVELGGQVITAGEHEPPGQSELIGLGAAVIILFFAFGSVIAMGLPLVTAIGGLVASMFLIGLLALTMTFGTQTRAFTAMIGIGVGIDYALFIVTRFREGLHAGASVEDAIVVAVNTAGRSILFAGSIVVVALLGLMTMGIPFVASLGLAAAIVVTLAVLVALTLLPALLALIGTRIDRWGLRSRSAGESRDGMRTRTRFADATQRHPWVVTGLSLVILLLLALPALDMRIGSSDAGNNPTSSTSRRAYDLVAAGFGEGYNGPLMLVVDTRNATDPGAVDRLMERLRATDGIARISGPRVEPGSDLAIISVVPETSPQSAQTQDLVHTLRNDVVAPELAGTGAEGHVGGPTAAYIDMADQISARLPVFFAVVIGLSVVLLMIVFLSILVPLQAAFMNLLSIGAAYGVLVAIFQWGWLAGVFGIDRTGPIESFLPMMLFAVLFGLSTDYEVFLVSRVQEVWLTTGDNRAAVNHGSAATMRVITAAASIMVVVFLSFTLSDVRIVKEFGLGLATAVFLDATVVRLLLVPALMSLFGRWNWYLPTWLDRALPRIALEHAGGQGVEADPAAPVGEGSPAD